MTYEEKARTVSKPSNLTLENRRKLAISGIEDVESFDEREVVMRTGEGNLVIRGSDLNIKTLNVEAGDVIVTGLITEVCYEEVAPKIECSRLFSSYFLGICGFDFGRLERVVLIISAR